MVKIFYDVETTGTDPRKDSIHRVATTLGIKLDKKALHNASYDVVLTREIYRIVTGRQLATNDELF